MNYIKLLTGFFEKVDTDNRLNPTHISMYMAIFQFWNINHFQNPISICRNQVMRVSKICSNATYHKCIKELNEYGYLEYFPSFNPYKGSLVHLFNLGSDEEEISLEKEDILPENLLLFDPQNEPVFDDKKEGNLTKIQTSTSVDNPVIHTKNQTGSSSSNPTKIDIGTVQALVPSINVINVIKENIYNIENEILKIEIPKKNISESSEKKEKSCAKKEPQNNSKKAPSGVGVKAPAGVGEIAPELDGKVGKEKEFQKAPLGVGVKAPSAVGGIPTLQEVLEYFILKKVAAIEGEKFFNYYESTGWLVGGKTKMKNWNAASRNWMLNVQSYNHEKQTLQVPNHLHVSKNKNYNEPL